jgi:uncharacterized protein YeaO (DUF488 family)
MKQLLFAALFFATISVSAADTTAVKKDSIIVKEYILNEQQFMLFQQLFADALQKQSEQQFKGFFDAIKQRAVNVKQPAKKEGN